MKKTGDLEQKELILKVTKSHNLAMWNAVKAMLDRGVVTSPQDQGFLMELLGDIANKYKDTNKPQKFKISFKKGRGIWHSLNVALNNDMIPPRYRPHSCEALSFLGIALDAALQTQQFEDMGIDNIEALPVENKSLSSSSLSLDKDSRPQLSIVEE